MTALKWCTLWGRLADSLARRCTQAVAIGGGAGVDIATKYAHLFKRAQSRADQAFSRMAHEEIVRTC